MITQSGQRVFPRDHELHDITQLPTLSDIAVGLSRQSRFAGQTVEFYSVLAHTLVVARLVDDEFRKSALLHDAPEAIVSDVPTPWKPDRLKTQEALLYGALAKVHGAQEKIGAEVHAADLAALKAEAHVLGHAAAEEFWPLSNFGELEVKAVLLTTEMLAADFPVTALTQPEWAIDCYTGAFEV